MADMAFESDHESNGDYNVFLSYFQRVATIFFPDIDPDFNN